MLPSPRQALVKSLFTRAVARAEWALAWGRIFLSIALTYRFFAVGSLGHPNGAHRAWLSVGSAVIAAGGSAWLAARARRRQITPGLVGFSVSLDALVCFTALLSDVLWPWSWYDGILRLPDSGGLLMAAFIAGFRGVPWAALLGGVLNLSSAVVLVLLDRAWNGPHLAYGWGDASIMFVYVSGMTAMAMLAATRTRRMVAMAASRAVRAERARRSLVEVLQDQHDARSVLSSATLNADALARAVDSGVAAPRAIVEDLRADLDELSQMVSTARELAFRELSALEEPTLASATAVAREVTARVGRRFSDRCFELAAPEEELLVNVAGGPRGLERIVSNLVVNACEGDGQRGAGRIRIVVEPQAPEVIISVIDDGPGLPPEGAPSIKPGGSGLGLDLCRRLALASGGTLELQREGETGCRAVLVLPAA